MVLILAFSLQDQVEKFGAYVGLAAFLGLAVLSLLYFAQARELKRLRDWAGRAPERAIEVEARVVAQAEQALREAEPAVAAQPVAAPASGNGRQAGTPAPIPMGPRPAVALAAAATAQAAVVTEEAPAVTDGDGPAEAPEAPGPEVPAVTDGDRPAARAVPVVAGGDQPEAPASPGSDRPEAPVAPSAPEEPVAPAGDRPETAEPAVPAAGESASAEDAEPEEAAEEPEAEPARSGNGVPTEPAAVPPASIPRATPRPQPKPRPVPAAPLRAATSSTTLPPRRTVTRRPQHGPSRAGLYTLIGVVVLAIAIAVPVYLMVFDEDEPTPAPNTTAAPPGTTTDTGAGEAIVEARPEKVVVVLNGTPIDGLASGERDKLIAAGYSDEQGMIRIDNNQDQQRQDSVVFYAPDERRQARDVARLLDITRYEEIDEETQALADSSDETGTLPADIVALLGADKSP